MRLKHLLWVALTLLAALPVLLLGAWVSKTALDREVAAVEEKHLLLARNMTAALERYAGDATAVFELFAANARNDIRSQEGVEALAHELGFGHVFIIDGDGQVERQVNGPAAEFRRLPAAVIAALQPHFGATPAFSPVTMNARGDPTLFLTQVITEDRILVAALSTAYLVDLQQAIAFGERGHAAIVDDTGQVIAHPNEQWQLEAKNISKIAPVRRMMNGETGVSRFFSPAMQADMISGFTTVAGPGWGVMVPQPFDELKAAARQVAGAAAAIASIGIVVAAVLAWTVADLLTRPLQAIGRAAERIREGHWLARVAPGDLRFATRETQELANCFNQMADHVENNRSLIKRALEDAQSADRAKTEFLANMSHELRTPLNAIIGFSDTIRMELLGPLEHDQYRRYVEDIRDSGAHLLEVINDILDLAKIESGRVDIEVEPVDLHSLLAETEVLMTPQAARSEVTLFTEIATDLPRVVTSGVRLKQVLLNLLSNAVKFASPNGHVTMAAWLETGDVIKFQVSDDGLGMTEDQLKTALTPFGQVESGLARNYQGTGLGLPIAKALAELLGGRLDISSKPRVGTIVTMTLQDVAIAPDQAAHG